jgi:hypothetical protein
MIVKLKAEGKFSIATMFSFYRKVTLRDVAYFSKIYHYTQFQDPALSCTNVTPTSQVCTSNFVNDACMKTKSIKLASNVIIYKTYFLKTSPLVQKLRRWSGTWIYA